MARWPALLMLAALALANAQSGFPACKSYQWQCATGDCINANGRCNGVRDCTDGSDEESAMCDNAFSIRVQVGQVTTVRAEHKEEDHAVFFHLCGGTSCSKLRLFGRNAGGELWYRAWAECNAPSGNCGSLHHENIPAGSKYFPVGLVVFKAERRPGELAVWLDGYEGKAATVPVKEGSDLLRVRPEYWTSDLAVQFESCSCSTKGGSCQSSTYVPEDGGCFEVQSGASVYVKPKERVSDKLHCSSEAVQCELQRGSSKQYGTEWAEARGTENSTAKTNSDSVGGSVEGGFYDLTSVPESFEHVWRKEMAEAMSKTVSMGWSNQTVAVSIPVCHIPPGRTGWVELKPEFYAKEAVVRYFNGTSASIVRLFPKTNADGSIAGERLCVVEKTETAWRRRRRNL